MKKNTDTAGIIDTVNTLMKRAVQAAAIFSQLDQETTDNITRAVYEAGFNNRVSLARQAFEETGMGVFEHKVIKNVIATHLVYEDIKHLKTAGIISRDEQLGIVEIAQPLGPILAVTPVTNPTSTVMFKILIALKTRNSIIVSPHHRAMNCSIEASRLCYEAALAAGAPEDCIQWTTTHSHEQTHALMSHPDLALILATGGSGLVRSAYSSGTPALGVGPGNVPVCIEKSADIPFAVSQVISSKTFDNGTICASEQSIVTEESIADDVKEEFVKQGARFLSPEEITKLEKVAFDPERGMMNVDIVGRSAEFIAQKAGIDIPPGTKLLIAPLDGVGDQWSLSSEILAPILAFYVARDFDGAVNLCLDINFNGDMGHTTSIFSNNEARIEEFATIMNAGRIVVNMPSSQGAVGGLYNTLSPSFTLGCGTGGKNITTDNITAHNLLNIQRIARKRINEKWFNISNDKFLDDSFTVEDVRKEYNRNF
jgi:acetaldehyde dehydrogenase/alcohol dehydrogenase